MDLVMAGQSWRIYSLSLLRTIAFRDAVSLVQYRSLIQNAVPRRPGIYGSSAGIGRQYSGKKSAKKIMDVHGGVVEPVNYNAPGQVVIAGEKELMKGSNSTKESGAKRALPLAVKRPCSCSLMKAAMSELSKRLSQTELKMPIYPVVQKCGCRSADGCKFD